MSDTLLKITEDALLLASRIHEGADLEEAEPGGRDHGASREFRIVELVVGLAERTAHVAGLKTGTVWVPTDLQQLVSEELVDPPPPTPAPHPSSIEAVQPLADRLRALGFNASPFQSGGGIFTVALYDPGANLEDDQYAYRAYVGWTEDIGGLLDGCSFDLGGEHIDNFEQGESESVADFVSRVFRSHKESRR